MAAAAVKELLTRHKHNDTRGGGPPQKNWYSHKAVNSYLDGCNPYSDNILLLRTLLRRG